MSKLVAANIVTYNRLPDLKKCLEAIKMQTFQDFDIIVVNNGSTDGTQEYLSTRSDIIVINQENLGSSGGQYAGMMYMMEHGYQWFWTMDDDGLPEEHQLEELIKYGKDYPFLNALVVDRDDHDRFAFNLGRYTILSEAKKLPVLSDFMHPFNGTFISRDVIEQIGVVKRELFIWGDEAEYVSRAKEAGYIPYTVTRAIHYHPKEKGIWKNAIPCVKKWQVLLKPKKLSMYFYRNQGYMLRRYKSRRLIAIRFFGLYTIYYVRKLQFAELLKLYRYFIRGYRCDFTV